jgi:hypothetical protein
MFLINSLIIEYSMNILHGDSNVPLNAAHKVQHVSSNDGTSELNPLNSWSILTRVSFAGDLPLKMVSFSSAH